MSSITVTLTGICTGGNHLTFGISGDKIATVHAMLDDLTQPISEEDALVFCRVIAQMAKAGRTMNQAKTLLQNGVVVTV